MSSVFQQARVKSIISGDTIVLSSVSNPRNERVLSLAYVTAPRMRRGDDEVPTHVNEASTHIQA